MRPHKLRQVLVTGRNHRFDAGLRGQPRQGTDDVVGLHALKHDERPAHRAHQRMDRLDLPYQVIRHGRTLRFVLGEDIITKGLALGVEYAGAVIGLVFAAQFLEHAHHAVHRAGGQAIGAAQVRQGMKGAVQVRRTVDHQESWHPVLPWCPC